ncbi:SxtJ family membrane protein [Chitinophaga sp.]|uniref:SxtJ family membrane protein n=1 Tax=Chitinophaga sp. TaxID=1869181 RepID=UPI002CE11A8D|nr:SxtJ family membrane protein [Chitinophaga sp.]HWV65045.1 SxtJ family membrane protein [Chitinophaga sp.]
MWKEITHISRQQCMESGQVAAAAMLAVSLYYRDFRLVAVALLFLLITLLAPRLLYPLAVVWFGLAKVLGEINVRILLTLVFIVVVIPVGMWRKWMRKDTLQLRRFKKDKGSVMDIRNHVYTKEDLQHTF